MEEHERRDLFTPEEVEYLEFVEEEAARARALLSPELRRLVVSPLRYRSISPCRVSRRDTGPV